jgi:hypothetical protein
MTELIAVPQVDQWSRLKALVLGSVSSPITRRVYNLGLDEYFAWYGSIRPAGDRRYRNTDFIYLPAV